MRCRDMVLLALCLALAGCGKKGSKGVDAEVPPEDLTPPDLPAEVEGTVVRTGSVQLPAGAAVRPTELQVLSPFEEATPDADGGFDIRVAESRKPQFVFTLDAETDNPVLVGYADPAGGNLDLSCESTAVSLAFLSPTMMGTPAEYRMEFIKAVKAHPDFPVLVAAIEAGFRADPQRLLDPEANPEIYQQAAELSIGAWEGVAAEEAAGKLAFRDMVPVIADEDSTGNAITFINPMFVYYVARIATADQALAGQSLALVTVDPVPQALNMTWDLPWRIIQAVIDESLDPLRESNSRKNYALDDGHFEVYLTKGFKGIDNPLTTANGRATLWNISRGLILAVEVAMEFAPSLGDVADNLDLEGGELLDLVVAIVGTDLTEGPDLRGGFEALLKVVSKQAEAFSKRSNVKISQKYADNLSKFLNAAEKPWQVITIGGKVINEGVPYVVDLIFATQEVQYELVHNGARITALRRQEPEAPLSGNEVERKETFDLRGGADMEMVWVPAEGGRGGFWLGTYEVTQAQWQAVLGTAPWTRARADMKKYVAEGPSYPAVNISYSDAHDFIGALNDAAGDSLYRLPTEEEWAYACRAGTQTAWSFGDAEEELRHFAWYQDNGGVFPIFKRVGGKLPNPWGLHDMHGNVEEWVQERAGMGGWFGGSADHTKWDAKTDLDVADPLLEIVGLRLLRTAEPATRPEPPETTVFQLMDGLAEMKFVQIEPGSFDMGSPPGEAGREEDEQQHEVTIRDRFWLAAHEVTQEQWEAVMGTTPWQEDGRDRTAVRSNPSHPAVYISYEDLREFIARLNRAEGKWWYRLPTEAEWEYACRAGSGTAWSHGADAGPLDKYAWYEDNARNAGENYAHAVGTKLPNPWGLHDMHGNVWEWVQDRYDPDYAPPASGSDRVVRGGGYSSAADDLRSANRSYAGADAGQSYIGARLVRGDTPGEWPEDVPFEEPAFEEPAFEEPAAATHLTYDDADDGSPAWSPDGQRIAFNSNRDGNYEIYVMNADGSGLTRLTHHDADDYAPAWSPDGQRIAFDSDREENGEINGEIYVMNADGSGLTRLTHHDASDYSPAWSPDGQRIAFHSSRDGNREIYVMNADGSGLTRLTHHDASDSLPAWSPDGQRIAFTSNRDGRNFEIYVMNADGSGLTRLTHHDAGDYAPAWSPDGQYIAFWSVRDENFEIYVMNADGSGLTRLTEGSAPAWSPDGQRIAFSSDREGNGEIYVMNADGWTPVDLSEAFAPEEPAAPPLGSETFSLPGGAEMEFVWIEPGTFEMGAPASEGGFGNERPVHEVEISEGFYLGTYEVTQGQWQAVMGDNPSHYEGIDRPVEMVSYDDAHAFIGRLNEAAGDSLYRLPTEAEWEYACRAGSRDPWSHGADEDQLGRYAWYSGNNDPSGTKPVGGKRPNGWGLHDMHGNVWEWAQDWFDPGYYGDSPRVDPPGPAAGTDRVVRGGKFSNNAAGVRSAYRGANAPGARINTIGLRLLRLEVPAQAPPAEVQPRETAVLKGHERWVRSVSFSPDGHTLASGGWGDGIRLWDVASGTQTAILQGGRDTDFVFSVSFSPDGHTLASGGHDATMLWDVASGTQTARLEEPEGRAFSVSFSPDGRTLASGRDDGTVRLWDMGSGTQTAVLEGLGWVRSVSFSPDGHTLASVDSEGIRLWDVASGTQTARLGSYGNILSVSFSPDGRTLASGEVLLVRLWDVASGTQTARLGHHEDRVYSVSFSPDGRTLASGGDDGTVRLWDVVGGTQTARLGHHEDRVYSVSFSPDGRTLASGGGTPEDGDLVGIIQLWDVAGTGR